MSKKTRRLTYRRCIWPDGLPLNLERVLIDFQEHWPTIEERTIPYRDSNSLQGAYHSYSAETGFRIHITRFIPNGSISTTSRTRVSEADQQPAGPPRDREFARGDLIAVIKNNDVVICTSGLIEPALLTYLRAIIYNVTNNQEQTSFTLEPVANANTVQMIRQSGVKSIVLNSSLYRATDQHLNRITEEVSRTSQIGKNMLGFVKDLVGISDAEMDVIDMENMSVSLTIKYKNKNRPNELGSDKFESLASEIAENPPDENDPQFKIITNNNNQITPDKLILSKIVRLEPLADTINIFDAFREIDSYFNYLSEENHLSG